jgi:hypothetical protein
MTPHGHLDLAHLPVGGTCASGAALGKRVCALGGVPDGNDPGCCHLVLSVPLLYILPTGVERSRARSPARGPKVITCDLTWATIEA